MSNSRPAKKGTMPSTDAPNTHSDRSSISATNERHDVRIRRRQTARLAVAAALVAIAIALAIDNAQSVTVSYLVGSASAPLVIALALTFALGAAVGCLANWRRQQH